MIDLNTKEGRMRAIEKIKKPHNCYRKEESYNQWEVYEGRQRKFVNSALAKELGAGAIKEMPVISMINIAKKIVSKEASLYLREPNRHLSEMSPDQMEAMERVYEKGNVNRVMKLANIASRLQLQSLIQVIPKNGKLEYRRLKNHQYDVIEDPENPTEALAYILSTYYPDDNYEPSEDMEKEIERRERETYIVWTKEVNYKMNGNGEIQGEVFPNPIAPDLPFIPVSSEKEDCYFVRQGEDVVDFSIMFNAILSKNQQISDMQGYAQAYIKGPKELQPNSITVGPTKILRLITDPETNMGTEFGFVSPSANLTEIQNSLDRLVNYFLTSRGADPATVTGNANGKQFNSAMERLLAMIESFEASQDDMDIFRRAEAMVFDITVKYLNVLRTTEDFDKDLTSGTISDNASMSCEYVKPEMIKTTKEVDETFTRRIENGSASRIDYIQELYNLSREEALERAKRIDADEGLSGDQGTEAI